MSACNAHSHALELHTTHMHTYIAHREQMNETMRYEINIQKSWYWMQINLVSITHWNIPHVVTLWFISAYAAKNHMPMPYR